MRSIVSDFGLLLCTTLVGFVLGCVVASSMMTNQSRETFMKYCTDRGDKYAVCAKIWETKNR